LLFLYEVSIFVAKFAAKKKEVPQQNEDMGAE
jgi:Sec-independent protein secretion pathway component TatC